MGRSYLGCRENISTGQLLRARRNWGHCGEYSGATLL